MEISKVFYVGDAGTPPMHLGPKEVLLTKTQCELSQIPFEAIDGLIVLCEPASDSENKKVARKSFAGIAFVQRLREKGFAKPIVFVSMLTKVQLLGRKNINCSIINAIGHGFHLMTSTPSIWIKNLQYIPALTELELYDIQHNYCNKIGQAQMELHALRSETTNLVTLHQKLQSCLDNVFGLFEQPVSPSLEAFNQLFPKLEDINKNQAIDFVEKACLGIIGNFAEEGTSVHQPTTTDKGWKVLYLDDEVEFDHPFVQALENRGVKVVMATTVDEALTTWKTSNLYQPEIMVVISDYRLEEIRDGVKVHQSKQGYSFLKEVSKSGQLVKMIALSAMPRRFLFESFKHYGIQCHIYSKKDFIIDSEEHINFLSEEIVRLGEDNWEAINNLPDTSGWKKLSPSYAYYRESPGYLMKEKQLNSIVNRCLAAPNQLYDLLSNLGCRARTNPHRFNPRDLEKDKKNFFERFLFRRLSIGLYQQLNLSLDEIFMAVKPDIEPHQLQANRPLFFTHLGLRLSDYPFGLTEEELNWLYFDLKIRDIKPQLTIYWDIIQKIKTATKIFFNEASIIKDALLSKNEYLSCNYNHEEIQIYITHDNIPVIRSFTAFRVLVGEINIALDKVREEKLALLASFYKYTQSLVQILQPHRNTDVRYKNLSSFILILSNNEGKRREKEYHELVQPWNLIPYHDAKKVIYEIIDSLRKEEIFLPKNRNEEYLYEGLKVQINAIKNISENDDPTLYNLIIVEAAKYYKEKQQAFYDRKYKIANYNDGIKRASNNGNTEDFTYQNIEEFSAFNPTFKFDTKTNLLSEEERNILIQRLTEIMNDIGVTEEDEDVRIHAKDTFLNLLQGVEFKNSFDIPADTTPYIGVAYFNANISNMLHTMREEILSAKFKMIMSVTEPGDVIPKLSAWLF